MSTRASKEALFSVVAQIAQAAANPHRLELLDLLLQAPRTVEQLADASGMSIANASQHLQRLKRAGLVTSTRQGTSIRYQIADLAVARFWIELRALATQQLPEFERALDGYRPRRKQFATIDLTHTIAGLRDGSIVLLDVRPRIEYLAGHLPFARSIPLDELTERIEELPSETLIVTYCRGPLCVYADQALEQILASGRQGARLEEGFAEWQLAESPLSRS